MLMQSILQICGHAARSPQTPKVLLNVAQVRYRKFVAFRKYVQPFFRQKLLLAACEPFEAMDLRQPSEKCFKLTPPDPKPDHPYDVLLAKDMEQEMEENQLVLFYHQNQITLRDRKFMKNAFQHEDAYMRFYNRDIARLCWEGTKFEPLIRMMAVGYDFTVLFAPDTTKLAKIIKLSKKYSEIHLLGGLFDKRKLLTLKQLEELSKMPNLDQQRAMVLQTLKLNQQTFSQALTYHTSDLSRMLDSHSKAPQTEQ